jgi:hypothetical protein
MANIPLDQPPSPPLVPSPCYEPPPSYTQATAPATANSTRFLPSALLLSSDTIRAADPVSPQPFYRIHRVSASEIYLSRLIAHDNDTDVAYTIQRLETDHFILFTQVKGGSAEIRLRMSVGAKGVCYSAFALPHDEDQTGKEQQGETLLLYSDGRQAGGRKWMYGGDSGRRSVVAIEKENKRNETFTSDDGARKLAFPESGMSLGDTVRELVVACWAARVWKWGEAEEAGKGESWREKGRKLKERIKGEHWEVDKNGNPIRVGRPSIAETFRRYNEEGTFV